MKGQVQEESVHQQQSLALTGRLLFIVIDNLPQKDLADSYLPTLDIISASGLNGIVETGKERIYTTPEQDTRTLGPEGVAWLELLGYDATVKGIPSFRNCHHGMRAFMATNDETVRIVSKAIDMDILPKQPTMESLFEVAANAITDSDGTHDAGFLFLTTNINTNIDGTQNKAGKMDGPSRQHQREVDVLEKIDHTLGNVVIPALINSSKSHGIAYTIVVTGDPYQAVTSQNMDGNNQPFVPFTITSLSSLCSTLENRDQLPSPISQPNPSSAVSLPSQKNGKAAGRGSRDSIQQFSFPDKEREKWGLGTLHASQVWEVVQTFFLDHVVCDSSDDLDSDANVDVVDVMEPTIRKSASALKSDDEAQDSAGIA